MTRISRLVVVFGVAVSAAPLLAQEADLFGKLDKNQDGVVAADEVDENARGLFDRLVRNADGDKDGKLSKAEFAQGLANRGNAAPAEAPRGEAPGGGRFAPGQMLQQLDKDGDGKISKAEATGRLAENFARIDANQDGFLDRSEMGRLMPRPPGEGSSAAMPGGPLLRVLDADGNGELSEAEIAQASKRLRRLDRNNDGKIDRSELAGMGAPSMEGRPGRPGLGGGNPQAMLERLKEADKNSDGKLSKEEAPERMRVIFDRADGNGDGQLEPEELRTFLGRLRPNNNP